MAIKTFNLPDPGEGLVEAEIVEWKVSPGDTVKVNDMVLEIETAKSLVELPIPWAGTVKELLVEVGQTIDVGTPIISIDDGKGGDDAPAAAPSIPGEKAASAEGAGGGSEAILVGYGAKAGATARRARKGLAAAPVAAAPTETEQVAAAAPVAEHAAPAPRVESPAPAVPVASAAGGRPKAKPPVRKLAKDLGIDLASVTPTGADGIITRDDVTNHASGAVVNGVAAQADSAVGGAAPAISRMPFGAGEREERTPIKGVRKMTAQAMVASAFTAPHVTEWITFDATKSMRLVQRLRDERDFKDVRVSPLLLVARAVSLAIRRTPEVNASWDEAAQEIVLKHYVNLGIAAATPRGLVVANIKNADAMSALELARAIGELTSVARSGKTQPAEMSGGTFTITNVGVFGVDSGTPILNPGESAILAMGAIRKQPWVVGNKVRPRWVTTLALSFDHRIVDGQQGSQFLADVASIVESPDKALLF